MKGIPKKKKKKFIIYFRCGPLSNRIASRKFHSFSQRDGVYMVDICSLTFLLSWDFGINTLLFFQVLYSFPLLGFHTGASIPRLHPVTSHPPSVLLNLLNYQAFNTLGINLALLFFSSSPLQFILHKKYLRSIFSKFEKLGLGVFKVLDKSTSMQY